MLAKSAHVFLVSGTIFPVEFILLPWVAVTVLLSYFSSWGIGLWSKGFYLGWEPPWKIIFLLYLVLPKCIDSGEMTGYEFLSNIFLESIPNEKQIDKRWEGYGVFSCVVCFFFFNTNIRASYVQVHFRCNAYHICCHTCRNTQ